MAVYNSLTARKSQQTSCTYAYSMRCRFSKHVVVMHTRSCCSVSRRAASHSSRKCAVGRGVYGCSSAITASQSAAN